MSIACVACGCHGWHMNNCPFYDGPRYYAPPSNALPAPQSEIESLRRALAAAQAITARWKKAVEGLTPSGSEYVDDPERCAAYIRHKGDVTLRLAIRLNEAQEEIARLTGAINSWKKEELLWMEREAQLLAQLAEAERNLDGIKRADEIAQQILKEAEARRERYATEDTEENCVMREFQAHLLNEEGGP